MPNPSGKGGFKKGQSGNRAGRPPKDEKRRRIEEKARQYSDEALKALADEAKNGKGAPRVAAAIAILDRGWGKPVERQESGDPGAFDPVDIPDDQLDAQIKDAAKEAIELGVKNGTVKVLVPKK